jgi:hypothetical protein
MMIQKKYTTSEDTLKNFTLQNSIFLNKSPVHHLYINVACYTGVFLLVLHAVVKHGQFSIAD